MKNICAHTVILMGVLLSSCALQKGHYMKGYHVQRSGDAEQDVEKQYISEKRLEAAIAAAAESDNLTASLRGGDVFVPEKAPVVFNESVTKPWTLPLQECDIIIQGNGKEIRAKITEISSDRIKYKDCDEPDGPVFTILPSKVASIKYADGIHQIFKAEIKENTPQINTGILK